MFQNPFESFAELKPSVIIVIAILLIAGIGILLYFRSKKNTPVKRVSTQMLVHGALCIALAFILSYLRFFRLPQGGSITPASMLPIFIYAYIYGFGPGSICAVAYGLLQLLQDFYATHLLSLVMDYPLAFGMLALCGLFSSRKKMLPLGILVGGLARFACHFLSGYIFFQEYVIEAGLSPVVYSLSYNISYILPDLALCLFVALLPMVSRFAERLKLQYRSKQNKPMQPQAS